MEALYVLLIVSLTVAAGFLLAFLWSVRKGQYDDTYTPSVRMLFDDDNTNATPAKDEKHDDASRRASSFPVRPGHETNQSKEHKT